MDEAIQGMSDAQVKQFKSRNPEYESIDTFAEYLLDDDRKTFTGVEMQRLATVLRLPYQQVKKGLEAASLALVKRDKDTYHRGIHRSSDNDRWWGPGSSKTHGGSGLSNT